MEHKAAKKAKKGILSIVFSRTALIVMLILLQIGALVLMYTILNDYLTYVYWITMAVQVFVIIYITNEQGTPGIQPDLDPADLDPACIRLPVLCICKTGDRNKICGGAACKNKAGYFTVFDAESGSGGRPPREQTGKCHSGLLYESSTAVSDIQEYKSNIFQYRTGKICGDDPPAEACGKIYFSGILYCI